MSNQVTLGASAAELTDKLVETATTIIDAEKKAREQVRSQNEPALRDRIYRAAGTMKSAYLIDTSEAVVHFRCADRSADGLPVRHGRAEAVRTGGTHPSGNADRRTAGPR